MLSTIRSVDGRVKLAVLVAYFLAAFHVSHPLGLVIVAAFAIVFAVVVRVSPEQVVKVMVPLAFVLVVTAVLQVVSWQDGNTVGKIGPVLVTDQGLMRALRMVVMQVSVVLASMAFMQCSDATQLARSLGQLLRPLERLGVNIDAFMLALTVAMAFVSVLAQEFSALRSAHAVRGVSFEGSVLERLRSYARLIAPLLRSSFRHADHMAESFLARCFGAQCR